MGWRSAATAEGRGRDRARVCRKSGGGVRERAAGAAAWRQEAGLVDIEEGVKLCLASLHSRRRREPSGAARARSTRAGRRRAGRGGAPRLPDRGQTRRVQLVRGEGRGVST